MMKRLFFCFAGFLFFTVSTVGASGAITVKDAAGRTTMLEKVPQRIVVVGMAPFIPLHMLYMFDQAKQRLVGYEAKVKKTDAFLALLDPGYEKKTALATNPGPESVAGLRPDLVIMKANVESALMRSLQRLGIPTVCLGAETPDLFLKDVSILGRIFGDPERADQIIRYYRGQMAFITGITKAGPGGKKPDVLLVEYSNRGKLLTLNVPARTWFQTQQVMLAGGNPVWLDRFTTGEGWQLTGFEQIAAWNPEMIFMVVWYQMKSTSVVRDLYGDSKWRALTAVKNRHLWLFPQDIFGWDSATPRWILGALWLAQKIYPQRFAATRADFNDQVVQFFKTIYHMDEEQVLRDIFPWINKHEFNP